MTSIRVRWRGAPDATRKDDPERGPMVMLCAAEARKRPLNDGELAWVYGPRRHELAIVYIDDSIPLGDVVLRDVAGASPSETVRVIKPDLDRRGHPPAYAWIGCDGSRNNPARLISRHCHCTAWRRLRRVRYRCSGGASAAPIR